MSGFIASGDCSNAAEYLYTKYLIHSIYVYPSVIHTYMCIYTYMDVDVSVVCICRYRYR